ncbi:MAG: glycosyltransferase family 2 protein [Muribaculaceae bacterium]|nr:glycosyltransferase family 2 protein [Muribaculaceae bacterium]
MQTITILIPAYNEALNLSRMVAELDRMASSTYTVDGTKMDMTRYGWEYLFVNDGSRDNTLEVLRTLRAANPRVNVLNLTRNYGKETAMLAGMDFSTGDAMVIMDADLQHPVDSIPEMVYWWQKGFDDVYGRRLSRGRESWLRRRLSLTYYALLQHTTRIEILQNVGDFRLLSRRAVRAITSLRETQRYTKGLYCWIGYPKKEITFEQGDRQAGTSSFRLSSLLNLAIEGITCFTTAPLRLSAVLGFAVSALSLLYLVFILVKTVFWGEPVAGFPTLMSVILFIGGVQLIVLGIIGEYIARIFNETKNRPAYLPESYNETPL